MISNVIPNFSLGWNRQVENSMNRKKNSSGMFLRFLRKPQLFQVRDYYLVNPVFIVTNSSRNTTY